MLLRLLFILSPKISSIFTYFNIYIRIIYTFIPSTYVISLTYLLILTYRIRYNILSMSYLHKIDIKRVINE